jgi:hypothetical protein
MRLGVCKRNAFSKLVERAAFRMEWRTGHVVDSLTGFAAKRLLFMEPSRPMERTFSEPQVLAGVQMRVDCVAGR